MDDRAEQQIAPLRRSLYEPMVPGRHSGRNDDVEARLYPPLEY